MKVRTTAELELMRKSGEISAKALKKVVESVREGMEIAELDRIATEVIKSNGGNLSFTSVEDYKWATCVTVNEEVVHGIPARPITLKKGDKVSIDLGTEYKGWHTDTAWSVMVGGEASKFLAVGEEAMWKGIGQVKDGARTGDIGEAIQRVVEGGGYQVVRALVGHGVGEQLHEDPEIPGYGTKGTGVELKEGMTIAVEVLYTEGTKEVVLEDDGWTIASADGSLGGLFEMTMIVGKDKAEVITDWRKVD
jgi:methionyl aminopeptidase